MNEDNEKKRQPDPQKLEVLRRLPSEITSSFSKEEVNAFLFEEDWPDSLKDKLKDYIVDE